MELQGRGSLNDAAGSQRQPEILGKLEGLSNALSRLEESYGELDKRLLQASRVTINRQKQPNPEEYDSSCEIALTLTSFTDRVSELFRMVNRRKRLLEL